MNIQKTILITGASRGIGKAIALKFLEEGWDVVGTSRSGKIDITHDNFTAYPLDISSEDSIDGLLKFLKAREMHVDVLVNNAGIHVDAGNKRVKTDILRKTLEVNLIGLIDFTEKLIDHNFLKAGSKIINMSSELGSLSRRSTSSSWPAYKISKTALNMYTKVLATGLSSQNIWVGAIEPGWVKTDLGGSSAPRLPEEPAQDIFDLVKKKSLSSGKVWYRGERAQW